MFEKYAKAYFSGSENVLEIGPSKCPSDYSDCIQNLQKPWDTLDVRDNSALTYPNSDPYKFKIPDEHYEIVLSGQVIEHVQKVWHWVPELARVTVPGGLVVIISPVSWWYHEAPVDCWRIYPEGMKALCEDAELDMELCEWGTLEVDSHIPTRGGIGQEFHSRLQRAVHRMFRPFGFPDEVSYDMITVARKRF